MKKPTKRETLNLVLSAFLILGYIVCCYFFLTMSATAPQLDPYVQALVFTVFGAIVFYATRIGDGKQVKRFSLWTLVVLDLPALYVIVASFTPSLPLSNFITNLGGNTPLEYSPLVILACIALGYGIPYTFLSGYEEQTDSSDAEAVAVLDKALEAFEEEGEPVIFALCDEDEEGAFLVVDDLDPELDEENEIRQMYAITEDGVAPVGSFVKLVETDCAELDIEEEVAEETAEEASEETEE